MPILMPMMMCAVPAECPQFALPPPALSIEKSIPDSDSTPISSSVDEELGAVLESTQMCKEWAFVEEGLWLRARPLPLLSKCYIENDNGDYRHFGVVSDWALVQKHMPKGLAIVNPSAMKVTILVLNETEREMEMKPGLRYLRCYPDLVGILVTQDNGIFQLQAWWRDDSEKPLPEGLQDSLVLAVVSVARPVDEHVSFW